MNMNLGTSWVGALSLLLVAPTWASIETLPAATPQIALELTAASPTPSPSSNPDTIDPVTRGILKRAVNSWRLSRDLVRVALGETDQAARKNRDGSPQVSFGELCFSMGGMAQIVFQSIGISAAAYDGLHQHIPNDAFVRVQARARQSVVDVAPFCGYRVPAENYLADLGELKQALSEVDQAITSALQLFEPL